MKFNNLRQGLGIHIRKSYTEGVYVDNNINRKLGRVGMSYGSYSERMKEFEDVKDEDNKDWGYNKDVILKRLSATKMTDRGFQFVKDILNDEFYTDGDIYEHNGKVFLNRTVSVDPKRDKDIINLGKIEEKKKETEVSDYYKFIEKAYGEKALEKILFTREGKTYGFLDVLAMHEDSYQTTINQAKKDIWYIDYYNSSLSEEEIYKQIEAISDTEAIKYIRTRDPYFTTSKYAKSHFNFIFQNRKLIEALKKYGVNFEDKDNLLDYSENFKDFIINSPRKEFYNILKDSISSVKDSYQAEMLLKARFCFKYNKLLVGSGWNEYTDEKGNISIQKRDNIFSLAQQFEFTIDDVLKDNKELFVNNPNVRYIEFEKDINWGGCSYSRQNKVIKITEDYFQNADWKKQDERATTMAKEKFMVEAILHELGHSTDITKDIYESPAYKDFARHLGYKENAQYTIYANAVIGDDGNSKNELFTYADIRFNIKKDKQQELVDKFKSTFEKSQENKWIKEDFIPSEQLEKIFITDYANKSACEGYAEYFSFYIGNQKQLDKYIQEFKQDKKKFLENRSMKDLYKYYVYQRHWESFIKDNKEYNKDNEESKKAKKKYVQLVLEHNMEMLIDMQTIVKDLKKKYKKN